MRHVNVAEVEPEKGSEHMGDEDKEWDCACCGRRGVINKEIQMICRCWGYCGDELCMEAALPCRTCKMDEDSYDPYAEQEQDRIPHDERS